MMVDDHCGPDAAERFRKRDRGPAVQKSVGLPGSVIYRHPAFDEVFAYLGEFDIEMTGHRIVR
jgi:hypothetical protein